MHLAPILLTRVQVPEELSDFDCLPVLNDWAITGLDMSSRVCATEHTKDPMPPIP